MRKRHALSDASAERYRLEKLFRRRILQTDILRVLVLGTLMAACLLTVAYVDLATGLWLAVAGAGILLFVWRLTEKRRNRAIQEELTLPELERAFDQMRFALDASLPEGEIAALYPEGYRVQCSGRIDGSWKGYSFTFANVMINGEGTIPLFRGQWLVVRTKWPDCVRVTIRAHENDTQQTKPASTSLTVLDRAFTEQYHIESDRAGDAETLLTDERLRAVLCSAEGSRLMVEQGTLHLAMPSEEPFFTLSGQETTAEEVSVNTRRQIGLICSWLDSVLQADFR